MIKKCANIDYRIFPRMRFFFAFSLYFCIAINLTAGFEYSNFASFNIIHCISNHHLIFIDQITN